MELNLYLFLSVDLRVVVVVLKIDKEDIKLYLQNVEVQKVLNLYQMGI